MLCKAYFHNYVADIKNEMFDGAANVILNRLAGAAEAVGQALGDSLQELAEKVSALSFMTQFSAYFLSQIEVSVAVLWEGPRDDPAQVKARVIVVDAVSDILKEVELWQEAAEIHRSGATREDAMEVV